MADELAKRVPDALSPEPQPTLLHSTSHLFHFLGQVVLDRELVQDLLGINAWLKGESSGALTRLLDEDPQAMTKLVALDMTVRETSENSDTFLAMLRRLAR